MCFCVFPKKDDSNILPRSENQVENQALRRRGGLGLRPHILLQFSPHLVITPFIVVPYFVFCTAKTHVIVLKVTPFNCVPDIVRKELKAVGSSLPNLDSYQFHTRLFEKNRFRKFVSDLWIDCQGSQAETNFRVRNHPKSA